VGRLAVSCIPPLGTTLTLLSGSIFNETFGRRLPYYCMEAFSRQLPDAGAVAEGSTGVRQAQNISRVVR